jgi:gluconate kinase
MVCRYHRAAWLSALRHVHYKETPCAAVNMPVVRSPIRRKIRDALRTVQPSPPKIQINLCGARLFLTQRLRLSESNPARSAGMFFMDYHREQVQ